MPATERVEARLQADFDRNASRALDDIEALQKHLTEIRASVEAWSTGGAARCEPRIYGNVHAAVVDSVAAFRSSAIAFYETQEPLQALRRLEDQS